MPTPDKPYLGLREAAALIGRTESSVRSMVFRRKIPHRRVAGRLCFLADEIDRWVREESPGLRLQEIKPET